ncbi:M23 family metallopeptidase [Consotaella aegiceratis]|uniref:M23 family metallopeptidase n=1 Tax=Consotaella aegiceratis TaxID=3097961 RepID=UPI002F3F4807
MTAAQLRSIFGESKQPHTVIIARGEKSREFTVRPLVLALAAGAASLLLMGSLGSASYVVISGELPSIGGQAEVEQDYETRIAALRAQLDRVTSRQMIDQQTLRTKVDVLLDQQDELSERYNKLTPLLKKAEAVGLLPTDIPVPTPRPARSEKFAAAEADLDASLLAFAPAARTDRLARFSLIDHSPQKDPVVSSDARASAQPPAGADIDRGDFILRIGDSLDDVEKDQIAQVQILTQNAWQKAGAIAAALRAGGLTVPPQSETDGQGGPLVPIRESSVFDSAFNELDAALGELEALKTATTRLPLRSPVVALRISSSFGVRGDPFLGTKAMHTGIDFVALRGSAVTATAGGRVVYAGSNGGYGNMVEVDHGGGFTTRYAHLSRISVSVGQEVMAGEVVGAVGSTGRSTGPHLHYEVRENGRAVNPSRFLQIGREIRSIA